MSFSSWKTTPSCYWNNLNLFASSVFSITILEFCLSTSCLFYKQANYTQFLHKSPFEILFQKTPKYDSIKIFSCLCYPWLKLYAKNKLEPRSTPCHYLVFSNKHYSHQCFDPLTSKIYLSRDILFLENQFRIDNIFHHSKRKHHKKCLLENLFVYTTITW